MLVSVIVPVVNEEEAIPAVWEGVRAELSRLRVDWEIIFVDDGSTDKSPAILDRLAAIDAHVRVLHFKRNFGQTAAMMAGFDHAAGGVIIPMDVDPIEGQTPPSSVHCPFRVGA